MPLRDHFRGWLPRKLQWHPFHNSWATYIAEALNGSLPEGSRAAANVQNKIEVDVATAGEGNGRPDATVGPGAELWAASADTLTLPFELAAESAEVLVYGMFDGEYLAAAIELVSERNKDRPDARGAFAAKCATHLHAGVGLVIFDPVTARAANLHDELMARLGADTPAWGERLYCTAYRPTGRNGTAELSVWRRALALGSPLPTVPLALLRGPTVSVDLEATYEDTFRRLRLPTEGPN